MSRFDPRRLAHLGRTMHDHVAHDHVGGVVWLASVGGQVEVGCAGRLTRGEPSPVRRDSIFRIASLTKPIIAVAALTLVEQGTLRLDDPVDEWLPELTDRRVLVDPRGPIDGATVPSQRPITVLDVLTFRLGMGMDLSAPWPQPFVDALGERNLGGGSVGPQALPSPDEWLRRLSSLPLVAQPGERWLYDTGGDVLGVLVARAAGQPLDVVLHERLFTPLGMRDTAFSTVDPERSTTSYVRDSTGAPEVFDHPAGQWATPPAFCSGASGLTSTVDDLHAFARMLLAGGRLPDGTRLLTSATVDAMTTDQLDVIHGASGPLPDGSQGWGLGVGVQLRRTGSGPPAGSYGWAGGLGSLWSNDPATALVGVLLCTDAFVGPHAPTAVIDDFWAGTYGSLDD